AKWTLMVYLSGNNDLSGRAYDNLVDMQSVGSTDDVKVVVQMKRRHSTVDDGHCRRYLVTKAVGATLLPSLVKDLDEDRKNTPGSKIDMGRPDALVDFVSWAMDTYPADRFALVLWGHGHGWKESSPAVVSFDGVCVDEWFMHGLSALDIRDALDRVEHRPNKPSKKLALLGFDACLMQMIEVAYECCGKCSMIVGSEANIPPRGWPYSAIIRALALGPKMDAEQLAKSIVEAYCDDFKDYKEDGHPKSTTLSALRADMVPVVADRIGAFASVLERDGSAVRDAYADCCKYECLDYLDLFHLARLLERSSYGPLKDAAAAVASIQSTLTAANAPHGEDLVDSYGMSIYFPRPEIYTLFKERYRSLSFGALNGWGAFLESDFYRSLTLIACLDRLEMLATVDEANSRGFAQFDPVFLKTELSTVVAYLQGTVKNSERRGTLATLPLLPQLNREATVSHDLTVLNSISWVNGDIPILKSVRDDAKAAYGRLWTRAQTSIGPERPYREYGLQALPNY
ncbi:MAG TPA: clostripain-related cysteine peptidase, partial [Planctomycetota bacterium]|nr:clostripain-related cysteine peptidase [Planctomycetota bacterium]